MTYKSKQEFKYLLFFVFHMLFQYFQRFVSVTSPYRIIFKAENVIVLMLLILAIGYEIHARRKFDRECGNPCKILTKDEIGCVVIIFASLSKKRIFTIGLEISQIIC